MTIEIENPLRDALYAYEENEFRKLKDAMAINDGGKKIRFLYLKASIFGSGDLYIKVMSSNDPTPILSREFNKEIANLKQYLECVQGNHRWILEWFGLKCSACGLQQKPIGRGKEVFLETEKQALEEEIASLEGEFLDHGGKKYFDLNEEIFDSIGEESAGYESLWKYLETLKPLWDKYNSILLNCKQKQHKKLEVVASSSERLIQCRICKERFAILPDNQTQPDMASIGEIIYSSICSLVQVIKLSYQKDISLSPKVIKSYHDFLGTLSTLDKEHIQYIVLWKYIDTLKPQRFHAHAPNLFKTPKIPHVLDHITRILNNQPSPDFDRRLAPLKLQQQQCGRKQSKLELLSLFLVFNEKDMKEGKGLRERLETENAKVREMNKDITSQMRELEHDWIRNSTLS